jgi:hypothetical protein
MAHTSQASPFGAWSLGMKHHQASASVWRFRDLADGLASQIEANTANAVAGMRVGGGMAAESRDLSLAHARWLGTGAWFQRL